MAKMSPIEKEIQFLYNKHNKNTNYPLEVEPIEFPQYITKILEKTTKRTKIETKKLTKYRNKILYNLQLKSWTLEDIYLEEQEKKRKEKQQKLAQTKDIKYKDDPTKIKHFGIWFDNNSTARLNRETYAIIDKKVHLKTPVFLIDYYNKNPNQRSQKYDDNYCTTYSDVWCNKHQQDCLKNFDLNIEFFAKLEKDKFEKTLSALLKRRKKFEQIYDINEYENVEGIYILVLDDYKQIYIGQSQNIKKRILQHWRKKKEFDKLLYGSIETSRLSIDSFGYLDTTRIFILKTHSFFELDNEEKFLVKAINDKYLLNRTAGGIHGNDPFAISEIVANSKDRKL